MLWSKYCYLWVEQDENLFIFRYIRDKLAVQAGLETLNQMKIKQEELQAKIDDLTAELEQLKLPPDSEVPVLEEEPLPDLEGDNPDVQPDVGAAEETPQTGENEP